MTDRRWSSNTSFLRTVDPADRVTLLDYPGTTLDVLYTYAAAPAACPVGGSYPGRSHAWSLVIGVRKWAATREIQPAA